MARGAWRVPCWRSWSGRSAGALAAIRHGGVLSEPIVNERSRLVENEKLTVKKRMVSDADTSTPTDSCTWIALYASTVRVTDAYAVTLRLALTTTKSTTPHALPTIAIVPLTW